METRVNFHTSQEVPAAELNAIQDYAQESMDRIVKELIFDDSRFVGLAVTKTGPLEISIGTGIFVSNGAVFAKGTVTLENLTSMLPSSGLRKVLVLVSGQLAETAIQSRRFLLDAATRATQPRPVATRKAREAVIDIVAGPASVSPSRPAVGAGWRVVAELVLGSSGITVDPEMEVANKALTLENAINSITLLEAQDRKFSSMMSTLRSEIVGLAKQLSKAATERKLNSVAQDVLYIRERLDLSDVASHLGLDTFASASESDEMFAGYTARVEGGAIQMGLASNGTKLIALSNPNDPKLDISASGLILPASTIEARLECDNYDSDVSIASYAVSTVVGKKQMLTRTYIFYATKAGKSFAEEFLKTNGQIRVRNPGTNEWQTISLVGRTWRIEQFGGDKKAWRLTVNEPYWDVDTIDVSTTGSRLAQTFLCAQAGWHKRIALYFSDASVAGDVHVKVCRLGSDSAPDLSKIIANATLAVGAIKKKNWTSIDFDPFFLQRGERYAFVVTTTGNHILGCALSNGLSNGTLVASTDGFSWQVDLAKDLMFRLYACKFAVTKVTIDVEDIDLTGGIRELQAMLTGYVPSGTDLVVQGRIAGVWRNLNETDDTVLAGAPSLIPLRLVFIGTKDLMPAIDLTKSRVVASRPLSSSVHVSTVRSLDGGVTTNKIIVRQISYDFVEANHDWTCTILHGGSYTTEVAATSVKDDVRPDGGKGRTWTFTVPAINSYRIKTTLGAVSIDNTHSVTWRRDEAV